MTTQAKLANMEVSNIWGVGRQNKQRLAALNILTILELTLADASFIYFFN